ncbi:MAG: aminoacetone oxidase family FAD-binding enzyme [Bacteroidales bacterium]|nr:aminoacetone oxidase family FAD-binding enzyme [Bacteroidales bacterium]
MEADIIIIGGGAAGLMAAYGAAERSRGAKVLVLEKMPRPGRKIMITGKGRCNFTNVKSWNDFSPHIRTNQGFIRAAFRNLTPENLIHFFGEHGLQTIIERGDRAYPSTYHASDVVDTLESAATKAGASILKDREVQSVRELSGGGFNLSCAGGETFTCKKLVIATGGLSYPATGSTGDGYDWAENMGHTVKTCFPSLTALVPDGYKTLPERMPRGSQKGHIDRSMPMSDWGKSLCGCSLKNVEVTAFAGQNVLQREFGDIDFTDGGIEGPIGFKLSRNCVKGLINGNKISLLIDLKPAVPKEELESRISSLSGLPAKVLLQKLLPSELIAGFTASNPQLFKGKLLNTKALSDALKAWKLDIAGFVGYERCVVTAGGVDTDEVVAKTMQSKITYGLYFCGEVLDVDCDTGGYNLHCAFATGLLAGQSAAK